jgi:hypothetical protein
VSDAIHLVSDFVYAITTPEELCNGAKKSREEEGESTISEKESSQEESQGAQEGKST